jgi:hypothetical protein
LAPLPDGVLSTLHIHSFIGLQTGKGVIVLPIRGYPAENFGGNQKREFLVELNLLFVNKRPKENLNLK